MFGKDDMEGAWLVVIISFAAISYFLINRNHSPHQDQIDPAHQAEFDRRIGKEVGQ